MRVRDKIKVFFKRSKLKTKGTEKKANEVEKKEVSGETKTERVFSEIRQVGVVVRDMDDTVKYLSSLGIGAFKSGSREPIIKSEVRGKPSDYKVKLMFAQLGQVELELIQPVEGDCIAKEFLDSKEEGVHHLGFFVDDLDKEVDRLAKQGFTVVQCGRRATGSGFAYLDTDKVGGIVLEIIQR